MGMRCEQPVIWFIVEMIRDRGISIFISNLMKEWIRGRPGLLVVGLLLTRAGGKVLLLLLLLRKIVEITGEAHTDISDCLDS